MTNRTREIFDFAQAEPLCLADIRSMLIECDDDEVGHVEQVADSLLKSIDLLGAPESEDAEQI